MKASTPTRKGQEKTESRGKGISFKLERRKKRGSQAIHNISESLLEIAIK
jgi:hypothetical protein